MDVPSWPPAARRTAWAGIAWALVAATAPGAGAATARSRLFRVEQYPRDLMGFYGQGYSVSRFLVEMGGKPRFLRFVRDGARSGWDEAARLHYDLADCQELDRAWRAWHQVVASAGPA